MWDLAEPQGTEQGSPNAKCSATPATGTEHNSRAERNWGVQAKRQRQEKPESGNSVRAKKTLQASRALTSQWMCTSSRLELDPHCKSTFRSTTMKGASKLQPKSSLQLHLITLLYLTQGGCKTVSSQIVTFIMQQAEQAKQFTWETVPRDFTTISFRPGTHQSLTHLPVGLQTCAWRTPLHPPRD